MNYKLDKFLNNKMREWIENAQKSDNPPCKDVLLDIRQGNNLCGFTLEKEEKNRYDNEVSFTFIKSETKIKIDCGIYDSKKRRWSSRPCISLGISGVGYSRWYIGIYPNLVYLVFKHSSEITEEFFALKAQLEKEAKIADISAKSVKAWLRVVLKDIDCEYYITGEEHKLTLSLKMQHGLQLDIPIYYNKFQKIMPDLLATIKEYENLINNRKVKVLVSNLKSKKNWQIRK
ncbi:hypothetical protein AGMMS49982_18660 [Bacteroidia bacterium]|nr:hypothetical protein AGMMS49982_18660 [Bacteroidia bacterium]